MQEDKLTLKNVCALTILLMLNPAYAAVYTMMYALRRNTYSSVLLFAIALGFFASVLNMTKMPEADQLEYLKQFQQTDKVGFVETLKYGGSGKIREPFYGIYVFISYYFLGGTTKLFFFQTSFLSLFFHYLALINISIRYKYSSYLVITGIISLTFFTQFYGLTLHLIRQVLATGLVLWAISLRARNDISYKIYMPLMLIASYMHSTSILLVIMSFIPNINDRLTYKRLVLFVLLSSMMAVLFPHVSNLIYSGQNSDGFATYALARAQMAEGMSDNPYGENMDSKTLYSMAMPLMFICMFFYYKRRISVPPMFVNLCIMMCVFVCSVSYSPLIQYRYFFYLYSFLIFLIPASISIVRTTLSKWCCLIISVSMVSYFLLTFTKHWTYWEFPDILIYPFPILLLLVNY